MNFEDNPADNELYERDLMLNEIKELQSALAAATAENERLRGEIKSRDMANDAAIACAEGAMEQMQSQLAAKDAMLAAATAFELPGVRFAKDYDKKSWYAIRSSNGHMSRSCASLNELAVHCIELGWLER